MLRFTVVFHLYVLHSIQPNTMESLFYFYFCWLLLQYKYKKYQIYCRKHMQVKKRRVRGQMSLVIRSDAALSRDKHTCIFLCFSFVLSPSLSSPFSVYNSQVQKCPLSIYTWNWQADKPNGSNRPFIAKVILETSDNSKRSCVTGLHDDQPLTLLSLDTHQLSSNTN